MKWLVILVVALGVFFVVSAGVHTGLIIASSGESTWSERAASTCAMCHGN
jgi:cytochrome c553